MKRKGAHVYVISMLGQPFVKVGISEHPKRRLRALQGANPYLLQLSWVSPAMPADEARRCELGAHHILREKAARGEWFGVEADIAMAAVITVSDIDPTGYDFDGPVYTGTKRTGREYLRRLERAEAELIYGETPEEWLEGYKRGPQPDNQVAYAPPLPGDDE